MDQQRQHRLNNLDNNRFKVEAIISEFPWLKTYCNPHASRKCPNVKRADRVLLYWTPRIPGRNIDALGEWTLDLEFFIGERLLFLDQDGGLIAEVKQRGYVVNPNRRWWNPRTWRPVIQPGETIHQAIANLGDVANSIRLILFLDISPPYSEYETDVVTIIKLPAGYASLGQWAAAELAKIKDEVRAEVVNG